MLGLGIGLPTLALLLFVLFLLQLNFKVDRSDAIIAQTHLIQQRLLDMETGLRGYQLTGDEQFLESLRTARPHLTKELDQLTALAREPEDAAAVLSLRTDIDHWLAFSAEALSATRRGEAGREPAFQLTGKTRMDQVRLRTLEIVHLSEVRRETLLRTRYVGRWILIGGMALLVLVGGPIASIWLSRLLREVSGSYEKSLDLVSQRAQELHTTLRSIGDAVVATNAEGTVVFLNPVAERLMGWTSNEACGKPLNEVFHVFNEQTGEVTESPVARVLRERIVVGLANHTVIRSRQGVEVPIEDSAAPILDDQGEVIGVILVFHDVAEKRDIELRLADAEWRSRTALEIGTAGSWVWEVEADRVTGDAMLAQTFGVPLENCQRGEKLARFVDAIHEEDRLRVEAAIGESIASGKNYDAEFRVRAEQDGWRWIQARGRMEPAIHGHTARLVGFLMDTTATKQAEQTLRESESRLIFLNSVGETTRNLTDPKEIMSAMARLLGEHLDVSRCAYAEVERDEERFRIIDDFTRNCLTSVGEYHLSLFGPHAAQQMQDGHTLIFSDTEEELAGKLGLESFRALAIRAIICCPLIRDGRLSAMMAVHQTTPRRWTEAEISLVQEIVERSWAFIERARAEAEGRERARAIVESSERFRLLAEMVSLQVWTAGVDGVLDFANQECGDYFGIPNFNSHSGGHHWQEYVHPEDLPATEVRWQTSLRTGERYETEFRLRRHDGEYRWFLARAEALRNTDGQIAKWFGTNTDIHALKVAQSEAEKASRAKDEFLAALSHELRTPLTPVLMTAAALRDDESLPAAAREQLGMMERNIALEARLIDDLLDLTRIARGRLDVRRQPCDAHSLIGLAIEIVRDESLAKSISIHRDFSARHSGLVADPARFQQVMWNLLRNAVKFTPRGGSIRIATRDETEGGSPRLVIEIADSGIGIPHQQLETIFLPFEQGGLTGDHRFGGIGLGLAIARAIVDLHGGEIHAHSEGPDRGATFVVEFPDATPPPLGAVENVTPLLPNTAAGSPATAQRPPLRLLLVEDHEPTLQVLSRLLGRAGHQVKAVSSVKEALSITAQESFDLVISDLGLPDGTGTELMRQLRDRHQLKGIALSGYGMDEDIARAHEAGFVTHLTKPVDFHQLERALREVV